MNLSEIEIRHEAKPGDIGYIVHMHGRIYGEEQGYGRSFEAYVAESMAEFCYDYNPEREAMWICEHEGRIIGFLSLVDRGERAQLRYFLIEKPYRGIGLGNLLMEKFMNFYRSHGYQGAYLLTANDLPAAAKLYHRNGFQLVNEEPSDKFGKKVTLQRYELNQNQ